MITITLTHIQPYTNEYQTNTNKYQKKIFKNYPSNIYLKKLVKYFQDCNPFVESMSDSQQYSLTFEGSKIVELFLFYLY